MRFVYKDIHFGAIATFYIIALLVRLITILVFNKFPSIETNYALQVSASLATGLGPAIGIGGWDLGVTCLFAFAYGLLEEYGWRGFLQYELRELPVWQYVLIITMMWLLWHLDLSYRSILPFFLLLLFASWGIGKVATDTHSLLFCAAFHGIVNFSKHGLLLNTTFLIAFICIIIFWFLIWYFINSPKYSKIKLSK